MTGTDSRSLSNSSDTGYGLGVTRNRAFLTFAIVSLALLMSSIDITVMHVALPFFLDVFDTNLAYAGWVVTGSQFAQSVVMPIAGKLSDDLGRKRLFLLAAALFTLSSLAAGFAPNIYWLIFFRILQGLGGGAFLPSATGIISDAFGKRRTSAIGLFASIFPIGGMIGPNVGGFILDHLSWHWIFFINIPFGILLIVLGTLVFPRGVSSPDSRRIDLAGAGLFSGGVLAFLFAMTAWANNPEKISGLTWALFVLGAVLMVFFIRQESRTDHPVIDLQLLRRKEFLAANLYNFIYGATVLGMFAFIPFYAIAAYGMTAGESGLMLTPRAVAVMVMAAITSLLITRLRYRLPMICGAVIMSISFFLLSQGYSDVVWFGRVVQNQVLLAAIVMLGGIGMGIVNPAATNAVLDLLPEKIAAVTGMRGMFRVTGGVFGTAVVVVILSHFTDKAAGMEVISLAFALLLLLLVPLAFIIPEKANTL